VVRRRTLIRWSLAALAGFAVFVALMVGIGEFLEHRYFSSGRDFDPTEWQAWGCDAQDCCFGDGPRLAMVDDLRTNHLRIGMRRASVIELLGPPDYKWSARELEYAMSGDIDCEFLELTFDKRDRLKLVEQMQG